MSNYYSQLCGWSAEKKEKWHKSVVGQYLGILRSNRRSHHILQYPTWYPTLSYNTLQEGLSHISHRQPGADS